MKNILYTFSEMNKNYNDLNDNNNLCNKIDFNFNYSKNLFYNNNEELNNKNELFNDIYNKDEMPFILEKNKLISKVTNLKLSIQSFSDLKSNNINIAYTNSFNKMLDLIHFSFCIGIPIIFEGIPRQGKKTSINYMAKLLDYEIENIVITSNFTINDLFFSQIISTEDEIEIKENETKLFKKLKGEKFENEIIFIFHNINYATSDVLFKISEIFNYNQEKIILLDGSNFHKKKKQI